MTVRRYLAAASSAAQIIPNILDNRGLEPLISRYILTETARGTAWLFVILDINRIMRVERYTHRETLHQISTALSGKRVMISNSNGLRYAILLSPPPSLPQNVDFPGSRAGMVLLGIDRRGQAVRTTWEDLGHLLVAGTTGMGKSNFLRLIGRQAIAHNMRLALVDRDGRSFPHLANHPSLIAPLATSDKGAEIVMRAVIGEIERRKSIYEMVPGYPDNLESYNAVARNPLPRLLVMVDEYNALITSLGGPDSEFGQMAKDIAWRGRKFGVTMVIAGQDFTKAIVGPVREQMMTRVCFRVERAVTSRIVLGENGAEILTAPGRAITNQWGMLQTYLTGLGDIEIEHGMTATELTLAKILLENYGGLMTEKSLRELGYSQREARDLQQDWESRGLAERGLNNAYTVKNPGSCARTNARTRTDKTDYQN